MPIKCKAMAGKKYRPSNGTEGLMFAERFCDRCVKLESCGIALWTMSLDVDDEDYPKQWRFDDEGRPTCTEFDNGKVARKPPVRFCDGQLSFLEN